MMGERSVNSFIFVKCSMLETIVGQALWVPILVEQIWMSVDIEEVIMTQSLVKQRAPVEFFLNSALEKHSTTAKPTIEFYFLWNYV